MRCSSAVRLCLLFLPSGCNFALPCFPTSHTAFTDTRMSQRLCDPPLAPQVLSELASVNIRLFPFAAALAKRGHTVLVSDPDHLHQVPIATLGPENKHIKAPNHHEHTSTQSKPAAALLADASDLRADTHA